MKRHPVRFFLIVFAAVASLIAVTLHFQAGFPTIPAWLTAANLFAFALWAWDKFQAKRKSWRVPEAVLHVVALSGAVPASLLAMSVFRHKTLKRHFKILYIVFLLIQVALFIWFDGRNA